MSIAPNAIILIAFIVFISLIVKAAAHRAQQKHVPVLVRHGSRRRTDLGARSDMDPRS